MKGAYELIEVLDERPLSYMSVETKASLQTIHQSGWFIPVTTRTTAQYERITLLSARDQTGVCRHDKWGLYPSSRQAA